MATTNGEEGRGSLECSRCHAFYFALLAGLCWRCVADDERRRVVPSGGEAAVDR